MVDRRLVSGETSGCSSLDVDLDIVARFMEDSSDKVAGMPKSGVPVNIFVKFKFSRTKKGLFQGHFQVQI